MKSETKKHSTIVQLWSLLWDTPLTSKALNWCGLAIYVSETHQISASNNGNNDINETDDAIIVLDLIVVAIYTGCHNNDTKVQKL
jgi:hypothetical protein